MNHRRTLLAVVTGWLLVFPGGARAEAHLVLPRPGQVGLGVQGQIGTLLRSGDYGEFAGSGGGIAVRLRYRMRYERAIGLSFESQEFDSRKIGSAGDTTLSRLKLITTGVEVYQMFGTRDRTTRMLSVGAGIAQPSAQLNNGDTTFPDDGVYASVGAGIERFFFGSWAIDASTRYFAIFQHEKTNHDFAASLGLIFYASY